MSDSKNLQSLLGNPYLKRKARKFGYVLLIFGLGILAVALISLLTNETLGAKKMKAFDLAYLFQGSGVFLIPSWLLLRFANGLFPFSKQIFKEES